ncbi:SDR family oxidoreductase, partial [Fulvivirga sp. RKSG066]|uniref:SDR family NAD(P)-dependent oxidoreductase n=1 Tax=Fulvivirga aurantia TaxID=2529383 RepID=UPI0012BCB585
TSGIGLALTNQLIDSGHNVTVMSRNKSDNLPGDAKHVKLDVLSEEVDTADLDEVDGLVYCPGSINLKPFKALKDDDFLNDYKINVLGAAKVIKALEGKLKKSDNGSVVLFSTVAVNQGMPYHASTAAAKGAVEGLGKSLAAEYAPKIRVNIVAPSITDTPMAENLLSSDDKREKSAKRHPMNAVGDPEDLAALTAFLLSEKAKWITGQVIGIDGGMSTLRSLQ